VLSWTARGGAAQYAFERRSIAYLEVGLARLALGRPLKDRRAGAGLDHMDLRTFESDEQVIGGPLRGGPWGAEHERTRAICCHRVASRPIGRAARDYTVYADRGRRDSEGAVSVEADQFDNSLWLGCAADDIEPGSCENIQAVKRSIAAWFSIIIIVSCLRDAGQAQHDERTDHELFAVILHSFLPSSQHLRSLSVTSYVRCDPR